VTADPTATNPNPTEDRTMTSTETTAEKDPQVAETDPTAAPGADATETDPEGGEATDSTANEAKTYRLRLRDMKAERDAVAAERDTLAGVVATYQRREVEALVGDRLLAASDLWVAGVELKDLLAEDGTVDGAKLTDALKGVLAERPHWNSRRRGVPRNIGQGQRESVGPQQTAGSVFSKVIHRP
jgi:hypothetical protein